MGPQVFAGLSVMYVLVLVAGVVAWRWDRGAQAVLFAKEIAKLNSQLNREVEERRAFEGYYILDDTAALDPEWQASMRAALLELDGNGPNGVTS